MRRARLLLVDDEPGMLRAMERILSGEYQVQCVAGGAEALKANEVYRPDLVISDIAMPGMDGFELMSRLKSLRSDVDVILVTGMAEPDALLIRAIREGAFYFVTKPFNREVLRTLIDRCLQIRVLREARRRDMARMSSELEEARRLQETMFPAAAWAGGGLQLAAAWVASSELGGDFFDHRETPEGGLAVLVADVSGHGVSAAMLTSLVKSAFLDAKSAGFDPFTVILNVERLMAGFSPSRFVTLFAGKFAPDSGEFSYASAGHPPPLVGKPGSWRRLDSTGPLVSPVPWGIPWQVGHDQLQADERLFIYTDGLTDLLSTGSARFGLQRIEQTLDSCPDPAVSLERMLGAARSFSAGRPQADDLTAVLVWRGGTAG
jgi:CheY-like chemotaxis protein